MREGEEGIVKLLLLAARLWPCANIANICSIQTPFAAWSCANIANIANIYSIQTPFAPTPSYITLHLPYSTYASALAFLANPAWLFLRYELEKGLRAVYPFPISIFTLATTLVTCPHIRLEFNTNCDNGVPLLPSKSNQFCIRHIQEFFSSQQLITSKHILLRRWVLLKIDTVFISLLLQC